MAPSTRKRKPATRQASPDASGSESEAEYGSESEASEPAVKKRKVAGKVKATVKANTTPRVKPGNKQPRPDIFNPQHPDQTIPHPPCFTPTRHHAIRYHRPILLDSQEDRVALLTWFDSVSTSRSMPWRKAWIDPATIPDADELRSALSVRAYEVWISEIMLQQTRVAVVIDYWKRWMARWPTIQDLAGAEPDDVLAAWRGLGYYSRASRIHAAAKLVVGDEVMRGLLPGDVKELEKKIPGVGRYTAGAVSSIVFGRAEAMVDGNVIRVLSRQLGVFADFKEKAAVELIWDAADALVKAVARDGTGDDDGVAVATHGSNRPGRWGQALMELGSTVCTPKPNCSICPVTWTCRAYGEGMRKAGVADETSAATNPQGDPATLDIEDLCTLCGPMVEEPDTATSKKPQAKAMTNTISKYFNSKEEESKSTASKRSPQALEAIVNYAAKFPTKGVKKAVRVEETIVCAIRRPDGHFLIQKRPEKGLLAGLWELPSIIIPDPTKATTQARKNMAQLFVRDLLKAPQGKPKLRCVADLGSLPWLFSHIKLTMHVYMFELEEDHAAVPVSARWETVEKIEDESMGTGMRKCWALVRDSESE